MSGAGAAYGVVEKASLRLGLTFAFARHSGESRNPFSPLSLALRPDVLAPGRGRYGRRHIYPPHPFRTRVRRALPRVGIKCKNESKNHKMDSVEPSLINRVRPPSPVGFKAGMTVVFAHRGAFSTTPCGSGLAFLRREWSARISPQLPSPGFRVDGVCRRGRPSAFVFFRRRTRRGGRESDGRSGKAQNLNNANNNSRKIG